MLRNSRRWKPGHHHHLLRKTGTLTKNEMVKRIFLAEVIFASVGAAMIPGVSFGMGGEKVEREDAYLCSSWGLLCNNARLKRDGEDGKGGDIGDPTRGLVVAARGGFGRMRRPGIPPGNSDSERS